MRINARGTKVRILDQIVADDFLDQHHRKKSALRSEVSQDLGLYFQDELVAVAVFTTPRTSGMRRKYTSELLRMAFKKDVRIPGGASKLIAYYIRTFKPADFFTYQDTSGENTRVYEHAGMRLVKDGAKSKKEYLVAPGKTLETASRREALGVPYAVRYGPDRILGTKLGEVIDPETGKRKTNKRLFLEELGWHIESTSGDSIWEWVDPSRTYYTYKITATDSDKYYYGVSHVKKGGATVQDCLNDGYYGTGGGEKSERNKFVSWKTRHAASLTKEIISLHSRQMEAYEKEAQLVGDLYKTDPNCLNSVGGGKSNGLTYQRTATRTTVKVCELHGSAKHNGNTCLKCVAERSHTLKVCPIHGETIHLGKLCRKCFSQGMKSEVTCELHGLAVAIGGVCRKCVSGKTFTERRCVKHGLATHRGASCVRCQNEANVTEQNCVTHGVVKHIGGTCYKCVSSASKAKAVCQIHGLAWHNGEHCLKCSLAKAQELKECAIHGLATHRGDHCFECGNRSKKAVCPTHGLANFRGDKCYKCMKKVDTRENCKIHGKVTFRKGKCLKCANSASVTVKACPVHGESKHRKDSCMRCNAAKMVHTRDHLGKGTRQGNCSYCATDASI